MIEVPIKIIFKYQDNETPGWDYDDDHLVPWVFDADKEVNGDPYNAKDLANLYRYVCYRLKLDNLSKKEFIKSFIDTCKKAAKEVNEAIYLETYDLTLYGKCSPMLAIDNYEYTEKVLVKRLGKLADGIRTFTKRIEPCLGQFFVNDKIIITDGLEKGRLTGPEDYHLAYDLPIGNYDIFKVFNKEGQLRATCLLQHGIDFYSVNWEDHLAYTSEKNKCTTQILCTKEAITNGTIDKLGQVNDVETDGHSYLVTPVLNEDGKARFATYYLAEQDKRIAGIAFDNIAYLRGQRGDLNADIREL